MPTPTPETCEVSCYVFHNGEPVEDALVTAQLIGTKNWAAWEYSSADGAIFTTQVLEATTDATGLATLTLLQQSATPGQEAKYRVVAYIDNQTVWERAINLPEADTALLSDLS